MCGIIGVFQNKDAIDQIKKGLGLMRYRGQSFGISSVHSTQYSKSISDLNIKGSSDAIGHVLHAVVSQVNQPLVNKGKLVTNSEIYNWKELSKEYDLFSRNDADLLLHLIEKIGFREALRKLDGPYAIAYWNDGKVYLARDIMGIKPLFYSKDGFAFASEKKVLLGLGYRDVYELNPREVLEWSVKFVLKRRKFFDIGHYEGSNLRDKLKGYLINSISKRVPDHMPGLLFSGGVDSSFIALILKQLNVPFKCYTAALKDPNMGEARDLIYSMKVAESLDLDHEIVTISKVDMEKYLKIIVPLIEDSNVVKVGVALPFFLACERAKKDGIKVILSGLGSEEIFAGYERHKKSNDINKECVSGLLKMYERDLYRDDVVTMFNNLELRVPFLDLDLVRFALKIPGEMKLDDRMNKKILREIAFELGLPKEFAFRKKDAAQYGSKFDRGISKLAKGKRKSEYLDTFASKKNVKLASLWSTGKDSVYAAYLMEKQNYEISCLITMDSRNPSSYMYHTPNIWLARLQAESYGKPLIVRETEGKKEDELDDLESALIEAKEKYNIEGVVTGALFSTYQRDRVEKICDRLSLKIFSPLWHMDQELEMRQLVKEGFEVILVSVAADGLTKEWLGRRINDQSIGELLKLNEKVGMNVAGEGGEFESLVLDCPMFKSKLHIDESKVFMDTEYSGVLSISRAHI